MAGTNPAMAPAKISRMVAPIAIEKFASGLLKKSLGGMFFEMSSSRPIPSTSPIYPANPVMTIASWRISMTIEKGVAPSAFRMPISLVRSFTDDHHDIAYPHDTGDDRPDADDPDEQPDPGKEGIEPSYIFAFVPDIHGPVIVYIKGMSAGKFCLGCLHHLICLFRGCIAGGKRDLVDHILAVENTLGGGDRYIDPPLFIIIPAEIPENPDNFEQNAIDLDILSSAMVSLPLKRASFTFSPMAATFLNSWISILFRKRPCSNSISLILP